MRIYGLVARSSRWPSASTWFFAPKPAAPCPPGDYDPRRTSDWPVTPERADAIRRDALRRAAVRLPVVRAAATRTESTTSDEPRRLPLPRRRATQARAPKFNCVLDGGEVVKVKYGRNSGDPCRGRAPRACCALLGYAADDVRIVPRLRCYGCPRFPFLTTPAARRWRERPPLLGPHGLRRRLHRLRVGGRRAPVRRRRRSKPPSAKGWAWFELESSQAPRADLDALRLLAVFLAHWDNKSENQRLVCLDDVPTQPDQPCAHAAADDPGPRARRSVRSR